MVRRDLWVLSISASSSTSETWSWSMSSEMSSKLSTSSWISSTSSWISSMSFSTSAILLAWRLTLIWIKSER